MKASCSNAPRLRRWNVPTKRIVGFTSFGTLGFGRNIVVSTPLGMTRWRHGKNRNEVFGTHRRPPVCGRRRRALLGRREHPELLADSRDVTDLVEARPVQRADVGGNRSTTHEVVVALSQQCVESGKIDLSDSPRPSEGAQRPAQFDLLVCVPGVVGPRTRTEHRDVVTKPDGAFASRCDIQPAPILLSDGK